METTKNTIKITKRKQYNNKYMFNNIKTKTTNEIQNIIIKQHKQQRKTANINRAPDLPKLKTHQTRNNKNATINLNVIFLSGPPNRG